MKSTNRVRTISAIGCAMLLACRSDTPTTPESTRPITIVSGADASDTVNTRLVQALIVEVRVNGALQKGVVVRFDALPSTNPLRPFDPPIILSRLTANQYGTFVADSTDGSGRARVLVQMGSLAGPTGIAISVPELGVVDTAKYTVRAGNAAKIGMTVRDTAVTVGATYNIGATVADRYGNARTDVPTFAPVNPYVTVDVAGVVKATGAGRALITVKSGAFTDTARVSIIPDFTIVGVSAVLGQGVIASTKLDGTGFLRLTSTSSSVMLPRWNPAGTSVVFYEGDPGSNSQLYSVDLAGTRTLVSAGTGPRARFFPTYSADGQKLFFSGNSGAYSMEIWSSQADGSAPTKLVSAPDVSSTDPSASPDGSKIVFSQGGGISTLDLGSKAIKSLGVNGRFPRFSPDGAQILFLTPGPSYDFNLAVMNADGSNVRVLPTRAYDLYSAPSWSPDGTWILLRMYSNLDLVRASNFEVLPVPKLNFSQASFKP